MLNIPATRKTIEKLVFGRGAWARGVLLYVDDLLTYLEEEDLAASVENTKQLLTVLLNGAADWEQYSDGGCSLVCDEDIAKRLCTSAQLKAFYKGVPLIRNRNWIEIQGFALYQAWWLLRQYAIFERGPDDM